MEKQVPTKLKLKMIFSSNIQYFTNSISFYSLAHFFNDQINRNVVVALRNLWFFVHTDLSSSCFTSQECTCFHQTLCQFILAILGGYPTALITCRPTGGPRCRSHKNREDGTHLVEPPARLLTKALILQYRTSNSRFGV